MNKLLLIFSFCLLQLGLAAQERMTGEQYIEKFKDLAILEMRRTGIPASITLAQGLLESGNGNSRLAKEANNHFGIKCKPEWKGRSVRADDDAPQECFRAYDKVEESYRDHSDFLVNGPRYAFLFELDPYDYKEWAKGLKKAGYATNPKYADLLISAIERYGLDQYDRQTGRIAKNKEKEHEQAPEPAAAPSMTFKYNGIEAYIVKAGDTYDGIADELHLMRWQIKKYNDLEKEDELRPGTILYLKPKKSKGKEDHHIVQEGESMYYISQLHAIKLKKLYKWNLMEEGQEAAAGERLNLRKKRDQAPKLLDEPKLATRQGIMQQTPPKKSNEALMMQPAGESDFSQNEVEADSLPKPVKRAPVERPAYHVVQSGETLYAIAGKYALPVQDLQAWNKLTGGSLIVGQKLVLRQPEQPAEQPKISPSGMLTAQSTDTTAIITRSAHADTMPATKASTPVKSTVTAGLPVNRTHTVVVGETLYSISKKEGIPLDSLMEWNNLSDHSLSVGQELVFFSQAEPETTTAMAEYHEVQPGETLYAIARKYQLSVDQLKEMNELPDNAISPGQKLKVGTP